MTAQPTPQPTYPSAPGQPAGPQDPGRTLGIVGLVLAFLAPLIGLIVSIIANSKSKAAGFKNTLAKAGIIVSIVVMLAVTAAVAIPTINVMNKCKELGPGTHQEGGVTYTCG